MSIKIAIAEDHKLVRKGICEIVNAFEGMQILLEAENGQELLDKLTPSRLPDIVLVDMEMPVLNGLDTIKAVKAKYPQIKIIVLTMYESDQFIIHAIQLGADAYLLKDEEPELLKKALISVNENGHYFTDRIAQAMRKNISEGLKSKAKPDLLTERELEVLKHICRGLSSKEIGEKMFIAQKTVEGHRENARQKLEARNTADMIVIAIRKGLIDPNEC